MVLVIAEAGVNHNGSIVLAHQLVSCAKAVGADAVKFQAFDAKHLDPPSLRRETLQSLQLSTNEMRELKNAAIAHGLEFIATPFGVSDLKFLVDELEVTTLKIASGNLDNRALLHAAAHSPCHVLLSTGMAGMDEVKEAYSMFGLGRVTLLQCTSAYPTPPEEVNIRAMIDMGGELKCRIGLSDHTLGSVAAVAAVGAGASVIEKHLTLDDTMDGPDHAASAEPAEFAAMVKNIRTAETMLGSRLKAPQPSEVQAVKILEGAAMGVVILGTGGHANDLLACFKDPVPRLAKGIEPSWEDDLICGMVDTPCRMNLIAKYGAGQFVEARAGTAEIARTVYCGAALQAMPGVIVQPGCRLEHFVVLGTGCIVSHDCTIEDFAVLAPGAVLAGGVTVGLGAFIGANATILPNLTIGRDAIVGAGAVVTKDVPAGRTFAGNPARPCGKTEVGLSEVGR